MTNYRHQNCCDKCKHCDQIVECDDWPQYFCTLNAPPKPKPMLEQLYECMQDPDLYDKVWEKSLDEWTEWKKGREVEPFGICDDFEEVEVKNG